MVTVTIHDVAKRAGVGVGTVSRILNGGHQVRPKTAERVQAAIEELEFVPNRAGRALARGRVANIAVLLPFVTHPSAVERVSGLIAGFRPTGLPMNLADVETPEQQHEQLRGLCGDLRPEGLVVVSLRLTDDELGSLRGAGVRPVLIDARAEGLSSFVVDDLAGGRLAVEYLLELGHTKIAFIGDLEHNPFGFVSSEQRHRGYVQAIEAAGVPRRFDYERTGQHGQDTAQAQATELFALPDPPTAVFAASDTQALGVLQAARQTGLRVPGDISVVGFDDIAVAELTGLTTVHQPLVESGRRAAGAVMRQMHDPGCAPEQVALPVHLVPRETTGRLRGTSRTVTRSPQRPATEASPSETRRGQS